MYSILCSISFAQFVEDFLELACFSTSSPVSCDQYVEDFLELAWFSPSSPLDDIMLSDATYLADLSFDLELLLFVRVWPPLIEVPSFVDDDLIFELDDLPLDLDDLTFDLDDLTFDLDDLTFDFEDQSSDSDDI